MSRWMAPTFPTAFMRGFRATTRHYGALLDTLEPRLVNGFIYVAARPVGAPKRAKKHPPRLIFALLRRLHPEIRRRVARMDEVFATKAWREDVRRWDTEWKPAITKELGALQSVDPAALSDQELSAHLARCRSAVERSIETHHRLNLCNMLPLGDYLVQAGAMTGLTTAELLAPLRGASPVSLGAASELAAAQAAIVADADAVRLLAGADPGAALAALRERPGAVGESVRAWLAAVGWRVATGYDVSDSCVQEMPELLIGSLRSRAASPAAVADALERVRAKVPAGRQGEFDELFAEARHTFRIRDERGCLNDAWATGIARRALLAAGERLTKAGKLVEAAHAVDLAPDEVEALVAGRAGPSRDEVAERVRYRTTHTVADAPANIGFPVSAPPPAEWLPAGAARGARAIGCTLAAMFEIAKKPKQGKRLTGLGASQNTGEGPARVVVTAADFARVRQGDILIARNTAPSYNVLLPLLGGIVTDRGGLLSHAAIVAREYGLPAVVGTGDATTAIPDGARVRVDGPSGTVEVLA
jgi:pyruvate,water dikinase